MRSLLFSVLVLVIGCSAQSNTEVLDGSPIEFEPATSNLTAGMTADEKAGKADGWDERDNYPEYYGFTSPPAQDVTLPGEFEDSNYLFLGWAESAWGFEQFYLDIIASAVDEIQVVIAMTSQQAVNALQADMAQVGIDSNKVIFLVVPIDSIWMRDYGPLGVRGTDGGLDIIDARYYWGRFQDDYFPTALTQYMRNVSVYRPQIDMEGGNILTDGTGRCVATDDHVARNQGWGHTAQDIREIFEEYFGCQQTTFVPTMVGEGTGHVDMHVHITGPGEVIVGAYPASEDPVNAPRLDETAQRLTAAGFRVRRISMPSNGGRRVFRSYTNALAVNDVVLVPVYAEDRRFENKALSVFQQAYPGRTIVPIFADDIIQWSGAIHCVTMTFQ